MRKVQHPQDLGETKKTTEKVTPYGVYDIGGPNNSYVSLGIQRDCARDVTINKRSAMRAASDRPGAGCTREKPPPSSPPMAAAPMVHACGSGSGRCNNSPTKPASHFRFATLSARHFQVEQDQHTACLFHRPENWRAVPLVSLCVRNALIANTTTKKGLSISCELDRNTYPKGIKVSDTGNKSSKHDS